MYFCCESGSVFLYLDRCSYFGYIISYILFACPFEWDFCAYNAHENTNFVLRLVNFVAIPTERLYSNSKHYQ